MSPSGCLTSCVVIFYWHMRIRNSFKSLYIDTQESDGDGFVPTIWPSHCLLFGLAGLIKSCIYTLAYSLMGPSLILTAKGDFPNLDLWLLKFVLLSSFTVYIITAFPIFCIFGQISKLTKFAMLKYSTIILVTIMFSVVGRVCLTWKISYLTGRLPSCFLYLNPQMPCLSINCFKEVCFTLLPK